MNQKQHHIQKDGSWGQLIAELQSLVDERTHHLELLQQVGPRTFDWTSCSSSTCCRMWGLSLLANQAAGVLQLQQLVL